MENFSIQQLFGGGIIWTLLVGFIAGLLARALKPGRDKLGMILTIVLGIAGALLARVVGLHFGWFTPTDIIGVFAAVIGAIVLLLIYSLARRNR
jgi:uncharacterized membrane protein YeaQ/YmgE (transglycosylase-associated protein family)